MGTLKAEQWAKVEAELRELAEAHGGRLTPDLVVATARAKKGSYLHAQFQWDVKKAAEQYWLDQARALIRRVRVEVTIHEEVVVVPQFVRDPLKDPSDQGYASITIVKQDQSQAEIAILHEFAMAQAYLERAQALAKVLKMEEAVEEVVTQVKALTKRVQPSPAIHPSL